MTKIDAIYIAKKEAFTSIYGKIRQDFGIDLYQADSREVAEIIFPTLREERELLGLREGEPRDKKRDAYKPEKLTGKVSLFSCLDDLAVCQSSLNPMTMEEAGPGYGYMFYRTYVNGFGAKMKAKAIQASDRVHFYLNGRLEDTQYQHEIGTEAEMYFENKENVLELLVENMVDIGQLNAKTRIQSIQSQYRPCILLNWLY